MATSSSSATASGGIGFFGMLAILFIALKLLGYVQWSWWAVTSPLWGPPLFIIFLVVFVWLFVRAYKAGARVIARKDKKRQAETNHG